MTLVQAAAALTLWRSGLWDTFDIAAALNGGGEMAVTEADVVNVIDLVRTRERGPDLYVVATGEP